MWVCRLPVHIGPRSVHRFYDNLRQICSLPMGRCRHRPLQSNARLHLNLPKISVEQLLPTGGQRRPPLQSRRIPICN